MEAKLKNLEKENIVWIVYIIISVFAIVSNALEKRYYYFHSLKDKNLYKTINIIIFIVAIIIYLYFISLDVHSKERDHNLHLFAAFLFLIGGIIYLYIECKHFSDTPIAII